jgi:Gylcosyl hydrolase family 115 C-terminal domain
VLQATFANIEPGKHVIKIWRLDDNVVLQKVVASSDTVPSSYLGAQP